jgi:electron transport complex protein RnfD
MSSVEIRSAPHIKDDMGVVRIMRNVVWSLLPLCAFSIWQYGISALASLVVITLACLAAEAFFLRLGRQSGDLGDWSATITGILLALTLPPGFPLWMGAVAGFVAIGLGKAIFGGIGHNLFNPALVGRAFAQGAFPSAIAAYTPSFMPGRFSEFIPSSLAAPLMTPSDNASWLAAAHLDGVSGATPLARWKFEGVVASNWDLLTSLSGHLPVGPSPLLILACGAYLAWRGYLDWRIPAAVLGSAALLAAALYPLNPGHFPEPGFVLLSGGLMLGAVYMATDMVTSPVTPNGMYLYGALIGVLTVIIRYSGGLPEGVMYAILIGNAATPMIERITQPKAFGTAPTKETRA